MTRLPLVLAAAILLLAGCEPETPAERTARVEGSVTISTWADPDSGCRYVMMSRSVGSRTGLLALAPKLRPDGTPECGR